MDYGYDPAKDAELRQRRGGVGFDDVVEVFRGVHLVTLKNDDPEQYRATGWCQGKLWTVIFEDIDDDLGTLRWLVTFWPATKNEREEYERAQKGAD